jgi:hypothetical protein
MLPRTLFLGRLIGTFSILVALSMFTHKQALIETVPILLRDRPLLLFIGMVTLVAGLAMVLAHNVWTGGLLNVVVTLIGWTILVRGLLLLLLPPEALITFFGMLHFEGLFYLYATISLALGVYLAFAAFSRAPLLPFPP